MTDATKLRPGFRAIVTAGASGIGRAIATALRAAGAEVRVCDIAPDTLAAFRANHPDIPAEEVDIADCAAVDRYFDATIAALGGLDLLVNNAGIAGPTQRIEDIPPDAWDRTIAVNLNGQFYAARKAVPALRATGDGALINISSVAGRLGYPLRTPYAATKWAIIGLTQSLAKELGPDGVRVNAILPGVVEGPRIDSVIEHRATAKGLSFEEMQADLLSGVSLRRMVTGVDIANTVLFLCSPAGRNISGQSLSVCGNVETL